MFDPETGEFIEQEHEDAETKASGSKSSSSGKMAGKRPSAKSASQSSDSKTARTHAAENDDDENNDGDDGKHSRHYHADEEEGGDAHAAADDEDGEGRNRRADRERDGEEEDGEGNGEADADDTNDANDAEAESGETEETPAREDALEETEKKPGLKKRISVTRGRLGDRDFAIVQLADRENISLEEARLRLFGESPATAVRPAPAEEEMTPLPVRENPAQLQAKINHLLEQRKAANKALDVEKATDLTDQIGELRLQMRETEQVLQSEAQARAVHHREAVITSATKAVELYPDAEREGSALFSAIESTRLQREKSDPSFFQNRNWPMVLAVEMAAELGVSPKSKKSAAPGKPGLEKKASAETKVAATPRKAARPAPPTPAPGTATGAAKPNPEASLRAELKAAKASKDADKIKAVIRKIDDFQARKR